MTELEHECLDRFPHWLDCLHEDVVALASLLTAESIPEAAQRHIAGALNYLTKSLDLIPDGVEDLGYLDDAFVIRVAASLAVAETPSVREVDIRGLLVRLAQEAKLIEQWMGNDFPRLVKVVRELGKGASRGRSVDDIITDPAIRAEAIREVQSWSKTYQKPSFHKDPQTLIKLRSFLSSRLP